jgi:hypothetical protein
MPPSDEIAIEFDPQHDHQNAYVFETNPSGVFSDYRRYDDTILDPDYDAVWEVKCRRTAFGWTAEYRIPLSQLRFTSASEQVTWGFDVWRRIRRKGEYGWWVGTPRGEVGRVSRFGHLIFPDGISAPRRLELLPYAAARLDVAQSESDVSGTAGGDLKAGLGTSATLSLALNPDFAQVEQDPAVLNLTIYESFFPEKRPFFLEDSQIFLPSIGLFRVFHSRRIGRSPGRFAVPQDSSFLH